MALGEARLLRLEERLDQAPALTIDGWCDADGEPCDPPADVWRKVHDVATGAWRWAAWVEDAALVVLLAEDDTLQVIEL